MPMCYTSPKGGTRELEFWVCSSRGTDKSMAVTVPADWTDDVIKSELEDWCSQFACFRGSLVRYGWNDKRAFGSRK